MVTYITEKENTTVIIVLILLNRAAFTLNFHFYKYDNLLMLLCKIDLMVH